MAGAIDWNTILIALFNKKKKHVERAKITKETKKHIDHIWLQYEKGNFDQYKSDPAYKIIHQRTHRIPRASFATCRSIIINIQLLSVTWTWAACSCYQIVRVVLVFFLFFTLPPPSFYRSIHSTGRPGLYYIFCKGFQPIVDLANCCVLLRFLLSALVRFHFYTPLKVWKSNLFFALFFFNFGCCSSMEGQSIKWLFWLDFRLSLFFSSHPAKYSTHFDTLSTRNKQ